MDKLRNLVEVRTEAGQPVQSGGRTITPRSQAVLLHLPWFHMIWNRPHSILVEENGEQRVIPIIDITRLALIAMLVASLTAGLAAVLAGLFSHHK